MYSGTFVLLWTVRSPALYTFLHLGSAPELFNAVSLSKAPHFISLNKGSSILWSCFLELGSWPIAHRTLKVDDRSSLLSA